jgi:hypothetical protein
MPIVETNPKQAFQKFETHMAEMVGRVLALPAGTTLTLIWTDAAAGTLSFTRGGIATSIPIETRFGELHLSLSQDLIALRDGRKYRLRTKRYAYKLLPSADPRADAVLRWEYDSETEDHKECRNHVHVNVAFPLGVGRLEFNRVHVPTAWVLVEHVLRFLIHDLHVAPKEPNWPDILRASETDFYEKFTSKRYKAAKAD